MIFWVVKCFIIIIIFFFLKSGGGKEDKVVERERRILKINKVEQGTRRQSSDRIGTPTSKPWWVGQTLTGTQIRQCTTIKYSTAKYRKLDANTTNNAGMKEVQAWFQLNPSKWRDYILAICFLAILSWNREVPNLLVQTMHEIELWIVSCWVVVLKLTTIQKDL